jgi:hypothetical protein
LWGQPNSFSYAALKRFGNYKSLQKLRKYYGEISIAEADLRGLAFAIGGNLIERAAHPSWQRATPHHQRL